PRGKRLFVDSVKTIENKGEGYISYMWQWKDDPSRIVPKLSYVKGFKPWGWVMGTGIYIEDVRKEIRALTNTLIKISLGISFLMALMLTYLARQSYSIERNRLNAELNLIESREKYRKLVEAVTEGTIMVIEGKFIYSNIIMLNMLGYSEKEFLELGLYDILAKDDSGYEKFKSAFSKETPAEFETSLKKKSGQTITVIINISPIEITGKNGFIVVARDISRDKQIAFELGETRERYNTLTGNLNIGIFRTTMGERGKFIEANPAALRILGFETREELFEVNIFDLFYNTDDKKVFVEDLLARGYIKNRIIQMKKEDGTSSFISLSAVTAKDASGNEKHYDCIIEDITEQKKIEEERESLIVELQTSLLFLNQPINPFLKENVFCEMSQSISDAVNTMAKSNYSAILVTNEDNKAVGIVTDRDIRERVVGSKKNLHSPVHEVMSSPLVSISDHAMIFEAILLMQEKGIKHLAVNDNGGKILGIISTDELMNIQRHSSTFLIREINNADSLDKIIKSHGKLPRLVKALIDSGANTKNITRIITVVSDSITVKLIEFAVRELGEPPVPFTFMSLGSEGREEQTLATDQDNAIIYEDVPEEIAKETSEYFSKLSDKVCTWLDKAGYSFCKGDSMCMNEKWCKPLGDWKKYFSHWINNADPRDLLEVNIFFDFRSVYGDSNLTEQLREHINEISKGQAPFFHHLAHTTLMYKAPVGLFGKIVLDTTGEHPETFSIKEAIKPIQNFARVYAIHNGIVETNTLERVNRLHEMKVINKSLFGEITGAYNFLMLLRLKHQAKALDENVPPDNYINPKELTNIEEIMLKKILSQITGFQSRLSLDFIGSL
ncbi:DUF294 nucleotidyltransferase-like domain-containing protein, partial [Spirochaetota bacterium]